MYARRRILGFVLCCGVHIAVGSLATGQDAPTAMRVSPAEVALPGPFERAQLLVTAPQAEGQYGPRSADLTRTAQYESSAPAVVTVTADGLLTAVADGSAVITVKHGALAQSIPVTVAGVTSPPQVDYDRCIKPLLTKAGCSAGACHASQHGKGGFKLSVFGFDPPGDHAAMTRERQGRRIDRLTPELSLLLRKPSMQTPHSGGKRLPAGSLEYAMLRAWIAGGAPPPKADAPHVAQLVIQPIRRVGKASEEQQIQAIAVYSDGARRDVTRLTRFDTMNDGVCRVSGTGLVRMARSGVAPVLVRFEGVAAVATFVVPFAESAELAGWQDLNYVDTHAAQKFRELGIEPSPLSSDATFVRRAFLDAIGRLPTPDETRAFIADQAGDKRVRLVDRLLGLTGDPNLDIYNDSYSALWTLRWSDLIRNTSTKVGEQGMWSMHNWIRESFRSNKPFDKFVRELITAKGSSFSSGPANYFRIASSPDDLAEATAQSLLGVRLQCAKCHHHPFENLSQSDYYSFAAFFSRVGSKGSQEFGLFGGETVVMVRAGGDVSHPKTGKVLPPKPLGADPVDNPIDRRIALADWLSRSDNKMLAQNVVNRYVGYLLGRGLVEPVDDLRDTNPASNPELFNALADDLVAHNYDLKYLLRTIMTSRLYQLDSQPTPRNALDDQFYSHFNVKRLQAEVLLDSLDDAAGVRSKFKNLPLGTRAIELPDAQYPDPFLVTFAKPVRASTCECERSSSESLAQAMHMLNGDVVAGKVAHAEGRLAKLLAAKAAPNAMYDELFLAAICRLPTDAERATLEQSRQQRNQDQPFYEDLLWSLVNMKEFLFVK